MHIFAGISEQIQKDSTRTTGQESTINDLLHLLHPANTNLSITISKHGCPDMHIYLLPFLTARQTWWHIEYTMQAVAELSIPPLRGRRNPALKIEQGKRSK